MTAVASTAGAPLTALLTESTVEPGSMRVDDEEAPGDTVSSWQALALEVRCLVSS